MIMLQGGCDNCGKLTQSDFDPSSFTNKDVKLICSDCYNRYYSQEAIREKKLNQVLDKSIWSKIKYLFKK